MLRFLLSYLILVSYGSAGYRDQVAGTIKWTHTEYGAGNYGRGHPKDPYGNLPRHSDQFKRLYEELDALALKKGKSGGVFYINDVREDWARYAAASLSIYAEQKGYQIQIRILAGDMEKIEVPVVDTAHLRNPEYGFVTSRAATLKRLANHSRSGLDLTIGFKDDISKLEARGLELKAVGQAAPYLFPDGKPFIGETMIYNLAPESVAIPVDKPLGYELAPCEAALIPVYSFPTF